MYAPKRKHQINFWFVFHESEQLIIIYISLNLKALIFLVESEKEVVHGDRGYILVFFSNNTVHFALSLL